LTHPTCATCRSFRNDPASLEAAFPGLLSLSSARGSVRAQDGLCDRHDIYLPSVACCPNYEIVDVIEDAGA
jgi:hypothetical protein